MKLIDWQLVHPEQLKVKPEAINARDDAEHQGQIQAWIIGDLPRWWNDLCRVLHITEYCCLADMSQLPDNLSGAWLFVNEKLLVTPVNGKVVSLNSLSIESNKKQVWEQICRYEF